MYILYSKKLDKFYKGQTSDIKYRLNSHNKGLEEYTRKGIPWKLIWLTFKENRKEAMKLERKLKNLDRKRLLVLLLKYDEGIIEGEMNFIMKLLAES